MSFKDQVLSFLAKKDWTSLCDLLEDTLKIDEKTDTFINASEASFLALNELLNEISKHVNDDASEVILTLVKCLFKALRNLMGVCNIKVDKYAGTLANSFKILQVLQVNNSAGSIDCIKMLFQFLINFLVRNPNAAKEMWDLFANMAEDLMKDKRYSYYASALIYNIFLNDPTLAVESKNIFETVLDLYKEKENSCNGYLTFLLELLIANRYLNYKYVDYKTEHRILYLQLLHQLLQDERQQQIDPKLIMTISNEFKKKSDCILKTVSNYVEEIEPVEVTLLLDILAALTSNEIYLEHVQADKSLLINCIFLLKSIQSLGKMSENEFTPIEKLSELKNPNNVALNHPAFGFKASLIRVLGNLVWKNKINQDEMRELDCIPLVLDCCSIDARNPFITQWAIFAIRNLCEGNEENLKFIANMNNRGVISTSALHEMGITLHSDGTNQIKIVPLDLN